MTTGAPSLEVLFDSAYDGPLNMAFDESLFRKQIQKSDPNSILRFYRFSCPTLTIGYGMWKAAREQMPLIRRITGGGIVSHAPEDLTYALITPIGSHSALKKVRDSYLFVHQILTNSLNALSVNADLYRYCHSVPKGTVLTSNKDSLRVRAERSEKSRDPSPDRPSGTGEPSGRPPLNQPAATPQDDTSRQQISYCFDSPVLHDVMLSGKKIAGAGQKRSLGYLLHQSSIAWSEILRENPSLNEREFCERFANDLAKELNLSVNEMQVGSTEIVNTEIASLTSPDRPDRPAPDAKAAVRRSNNRRSLAMTSLKGLQKTPSLRESRRPTKQSRFRISHG